MFKKLCSIRNPSEWGASQAILSIPRPLQLFFHIFTRVASMHIPIPIFSPTHTHTPSSCIHFGILCNAHSKAGSPRLALSSCARGRFAGEVSAKSPRGRHGLTDTRESEPLLHHKEISGSHRTGRRESQNQISLNWIDYRRKPWLGSTKPGASPSLDFRRLRRYACCSPSMMTNM